MLAVQQQTNIDILYQMAINRLDAQFKRIDGADTKIGVTFVISNAITAALASFIASIQQPVPQFVLIFAILAGIAYVVTLLLLFLAYRGGKWSFNPDIRTLRNICVDSRLRGYPNTVKEWVAAECVRSLDWNSRRLTTKLRRAYFALIAVSAQGLLLAVSFVCYLLN